MKTGRDGKKQNKTKSTKKLNKQKAAQLLGDWGGGEAHLKRKVFDCQQKAREAGASLEMGGDSGGEIPIVVSPAWLKHLKLGQRGSNSTAKVKWWTEVHQHRSRWAMGGPIAISPRSLRILNTEISLEKWTLNAEFVGMVTMSSDNSTSVLEDRSSGNKNTFSTCL